MKKIKQVALFVLYFLLMVSSINLHFKVMKNPTGIWLYNLLTLVIFIVIGGLCLVIYHSLASENKKLDENSEKDKLQLQIDREVYQYIIEGYNLTKREAEIGYLIVSDYSNAMIAEELFIAETTVKKHVSHIYEKTGTNSRKELKLLILNNIQESR